MKDASLQRPAKVTVQFIIKQSKPCETSPVLHSGNLRRIKPLSLDSGIELSLLVMKMGIEPITLFLKGIRSTNWAISQSDWWCAIPVVPFSFEEQNATHHPMLSPTSYSHDWTRYSALSNISLLQLTSAFCCHTSDWLISWFFLENYLCWRGVYRCQPILNNPVSPSYPFLPKSLKLSPFFMKTREVSFAWMYHSSWR